MLVLKRYKRSVTQIGNATITIVDTGRGWVKLGIEAPVSMPILREEAVKRDLVERLASGEPLHSIEARHDLEEACRPSERDMIGRPMAMQAQLSALVAENTRLREELAEVRAKLGNREHIE